jgi:hypothetical protein
MLLPIKTNDNTRYLIITFEQKADFTSKVWLLCGLGFMKFDLKSYASHQSYKIPVQTIEAQTTYHSRSVRRQYRWALY